MEGVVPIHSLTALCKSNEITQTTSLCESQNIRKTKIENL